ncbi:MAG TPA: type IA DNA topoisomerase [Longimicrobiales bacterium]|nr:type IA DNA topoisomerase [Longimicrobiales bacterium]
MNVLIVESGAKAKTLQSYLGDGWSVLATGGHVETLPNDRKTHGKDAGKAFWLNRPGELPSPPWVWTDRGQEAVRKILEEAGEDAEFWIATDPDREGEFIAWCLDRILGEHGPTHRVAFQEVTKEAVEAALAHPRGVDHGMVDSALVRKFLDRLVGYRTSKMANAVVAGKGASMGRVQTPTLGFVVERELEREAHVPIPYFEVHALAAGIDLEVRFHEPEEDDAWRDEAGKVHPSRTFAGEAAESAAAALAAAGEVSVTAAKEGTRQRRPAAPLSTDALLQAAGSRFGWSPRKTSALASMLYEAGHITYIRTDSTRLAASAVQKIRDVVKGAFGEDHLGRETRAAAATGPVQDAHEAIRPTRMEVEEPELEDGDARRLYRLVRGHTLASQMAPSVRTVVSIEGACAGLDRPLTGSVSWRTFAGWEAAYAEFMSDVATSPPDAPLEAGAVWTLDPATEERDNPLLIEDQTRPPARHRPHTLIKAMKDAGIGRPSTYSRTVEKLEERSYVTVEDGSVVPTERGRTVWLEAAPLYSEDADEDHDAVELFSPEYTALMEERLDRIARGEVPAPESWEEWRDQIRDLHALAQERKKAGRILPGQRQMLERLLANAPGREEDARRVAAGELSHEEARELITELKEEGVQPAPTEGQMSYMWELVADLGLSPDELEALTGVRSPDEVENSVQASAALDELRRVYEERRPPSAKQRRFIDDLLKQTGVSEEEAAAMVGVASLDELTGGSEGTASALIDQLQEMGGKG